MPVTLAVKDPAFPNALPKSNALRDSCKTWIGTTHEALYLRSTAQIKRRETINYHSKPYPDQAQVTPQFLEGL